MAKKVKAKAAKRATSKAGKAKAREKKTRHRKPSQPTLPGAGQVRNRALDRFCEKIGETRDAINELLGEKASIEQSALQQMRRDATFTYTHHGITLVRVPGEDKLKVTKARDGQASASSDIEETDEGAPETEAHGAGGSTNGADAGGFSGEAAGSIE